MNSKMKVKIIDTNFAHAKFSTDFQESKHVDWDRDTRFLTAEDIVFLTDNSMRLMTNGKRYGFMMEPRAINSSIYEWVKSNYSTFDTIFTYDKELLDTSKVFKFYPHSGCWIKPEDQKIYEKNKLVSIVASNKQSTFGHRLRHESISVAKNNGINLDVYGRGYSPIEYKLEAFSGYAFSIVIENSKFDYYFTEKLIDSFMTGTVPIYWGCPSIGDFFNLDGMIVFNDVNDLISKLKSLSLEKYKSMLPAVKENFELAKKFLIAEDWIYENTNVFK
jgi:hypothetical protein